MTKRRLARLTLLLASLALALGAAEIALRLHYRKPFRPGHDYWHEHDARLGWRHRRSFAADPKPPDVLRSFHVALNGWGLRDDRERTSEPAPGVARIAALGDSFTFGYMVEAKDAFPAALERAIDRRQKVEVLNYGVSAYGVDQMRLLLDEALERKPRLVVFAFIGDDLRRATRATYMNGEPKPLFALRDDGSLELTHVPVPAIEPGQVVTRADVEGSSFVLWKLGDAWRRLHGAFSSDHAPVAERWRLGRAIVADAARASKAKGTRFLAVLLPSLATMPDPYRALLPELERDGVATLDAWPAFEPRARELFFDGDPHPNEEGHKLIAEEIRACIEARRLLAPD